MKLSSWEKMSFDNFFEAHGGLKTVENSGVSKGYSDFRDFQAGVFGSLFQSNPDFDNPSPEWASKVFNEMRGMKEWKDIRSQGTVFDSFQSGLGTSVLSEQILSTLPKMEDRNPKDVERDLNGLEDMQDRPNYQVTKEKLEQELANSKKAWSEAINNLDGYQVRQAIRRGLGKAKEALDDASEANSVFGYDNSTSGAASLTGDQQKLRVMEMIRNSAKLKQIMEMAGRFKNEAEKHQANKKQPGPDEITDIEMGNDIGRLIPAEAMKLVAGDLELDFFKRYLEKGLVQYRLDEHITEKKGPIVVCIDNSGSMVGAPEIWSKAVGLAMAFVASKQKRAFRIIHFSECVRHEQEFTSPFNTEDLLKCMEMFFGGGTDFSSALGKAFSSVTENVSMSKADIVFITDGLCNIPDKEALSNTKKKLGARLFSVVIGGVPADGDDLKSLSDKLWSIDASDLNNTEHIKETIFQI
ncbi:MAG: VWA domain-containing protein [Candidatus Paceibacterota bacterium]